jgi:hypothetical protein
VRNAILASSTLIAQHLKVVAAFGAPPTA